MKEKSIGDSWSAGILAKRARTGYTTGSVTTEQKAKTNEGDSSSANIPRTARISKSHISALRNI